MDSWTIAFDCKLGDGTYSALRNLLKVKSTSGLASVQISVNTSGYLAVYDATTLKNTSSIKVSNGKRNRIVVTSDVLDGLIYVYIDGTLVSSFAPTNGLMLWNLGIFKDNLTEATRATGYKLSNLVIWQGRMDIYNIKKIFNNEYPQAGIVFAHDMQVLPTEQMLLSQIGNGTFAVLGAGANGFQNAFEGENVFTDTEKEKLANSITGTFTTADGKTITITDGMVTSIV